MLSSTPPEIADLRSAPTGPALAALHAEVSRWFAANARPLPWRAPDCPPWGIMVSEFMLQQTPVVRVLPVWEQWMKRWPTPADLAAEPVGEAVRMWGRLGYPRRALRLHAAATAIVQEHDGAVPARRAQLLALPGVGTYTAAAIASFAFRQPETVVDTNVRRVHARLVSGRALPEPALTAAEMRLAEALMPGTSPGPGTETGSGTGTGSGTDPAVQAGTDNGAGSQAAFRWNAGVMELGALVCTARSPRCGVCPVAASCAWLAAGRPEPHYVPKGQAWAGTDRQVRGAMMAVLRSADRPLPRGILLGAVDVVAVAEPAEADVRLRPGLAELDRLHALGAADEQLLRSLEGLLADGLAEQTDDGVRLPA